MSRNITARWSVSVHAGGLGVDSWFVFAGLSELAASGRIDLRYTSRRPPPGRGPWIEVVDRENKQSWTVSIDTIDQAYLNSFDRCSTADVTFKRSFSSESVERLPTEIGSRVAPLGFICEGRSGHERGALKYWVAQLRSMGIGGVARAPRKALRSTVTKFWLAVGRTRPARGLPPLLTALEAAPKPSAPRVLFQVRAWEPHLGENPSDREQVNQERAQTIRALKEELGRFFVGGFIPTDYARRTFPDCLSELPTDTISYWRIIRQCDICVSTIGLHRSNPFKLAEYLAASRVIVSEPLQFAVPRGLREGSEIRTFTTPDQCVRVCRELLDDAGLRAKMQHASYEYYRSEVRPAALMWNRLNDLDRFANGGRQAQGHAASDRASKADHRSRWQPR
jgi:hypothetical protein